MKKYFLMMMCFGLVSALHAATFLNFDHDDIIKFRGKNRKGKTTHTIVNKVGVTRVVYVSHDVDTLLVFPSKIDTHSFPGQDFLAFEPKLKSGNLENNFVIKNMKGAAAIGQRVVGHVICENGVAYSVKLVLVDKNQSNHNVYWVCRKIAKK